MADTRYGQTNVRTHLLPDSASPLAVTPGAVGAWGAWAELTAGIASELWLLAVVLGVSTSGAAWQVQMGTGAAGSEVVRWTGALGHLALVYGADCLVCPLLFAADIAADTRIAFRARCIPGQPAIYVWCQYVLDSDL